MASEDVQPGLVIAGRYRVERQLGEGGMGSVFLVQHVHTDERFALKVLHKAIVENQVALERFQREARTPARIDSDHVVRVTDADIAPELGGAPFLVMEYLRGQDLEQVVTSRGALPPADVVAYLRQASRGLDKAHALGIIHRDLKPENLFLTEREDGTPFIKVLDFGIAKLTRSNDSATKTATGQIFGTPMFMSPEQALAESAKISPQTDVWALGLIAHKLLTGVDVWTAENLTQLVAQIAFQPMPVPSHRGVTLGPGYDAWFARCCSREVAERFTSAGEAVTELAKALQVVEHRHGANGPSVLLFGSGPVSHDAAALANTSQLTAGDAMKLSAGPLTRSDLQVGSAPPRRQVGLWVGVVTALVAGVAVTGMFLVQPGRSPASGEDPAGVGGVASVDPRPPASVDGASVKVVPSIEVAPSAAVVPSAASAAPLATRPGGRPRTAASAASSASAAASSASAAASSEGPAASAGAAASAPPAASTAPSAKPPASAAPGTAAPGSPKASADPPAGRR